MLEELLENLLLQLEQAAELGFPEVVFDILEDIAVIRFQLANEMGPDGKPRGES